MPAQEVPRYAALVRWRLAGRAGQPARWVAASSRTSKNSLGHRRAVTKPDLVRSFPQSRGAASPTRWIWGSHRARLVRHGDPHYFDGFHADDASGALFALSPPPRTTEVPLCRSIGNIGERRQVPQSPKSTLTEK